MPRILDYRPADDDLARRMKRDKLTGSLRPVVLDWGPIAGHIRHLVMVTGVFHDKRLMAIYQRRAGNRIQIVRAEHWTGTTQFREATEEDFRQLSRASECYRIGTGETETTTDHQA